MTSRRSRKNRTDVFGAENSVPTEQDKWLRPKKSLRFLVIGRLQNRYDDTPFFLGNDLFFHLASNEIYVYAVIGTRPNFPYIKYGGYIIHVQYTLLLEPDQISRTQSMVAKRSRTNRANVHTPM